MEKFWFQVLDEARQRGNEPNATTLSRIAEEKNVKVNWREAVELYRHLGRRGRKGIYVPPPHVIEFVGAYLREHQPKRIFDPFAEVGCFLAGVAEGAEAEETIGLVSNPEMQKLAELLKTEHRSQWLRGETESLNRTLDDFEAVVGFPPFGVRNRQPERFVASSGTEFVVRDDAGEVQILRALQYLKEDGVGVFILPPKFFFRRGNDALAALPVLGFSVTAAIELPPGTFSPWIGIPANIVFIERKHNEEIFTARLEPGQDNNTLLQNLLKGKEGRVPELGRLVKADKFESFTKVALGEQVHQLTKRSGTEAVKLADVVEAINTVRPKGNESFEEGLNAVYLPLIGESDAVVELSDGRMKPQNYAQLVLKPGAAQAEYLTGFFNSELGRLVRKELASGFGISRIMKRALQEATIYLPSTVEIQEKAVTAAATIAELRLQLDSLEKQLWERPVDAPKIAKEAEALRRDDSLKAWMETLPFPLASILWRTIADDSYQAKVKHLLHFF